MAISEYVGKTMIAWHYYNENYTGEYASGPNRRSYVYPRILKKTDTEFVTIQDCENEFPKKGRIEVRLTADLTAEDLYAEVGEIVEIRINREPECNTESNNYYSLRLNRNLGKERTEIWMEKFSGKGFTQIVPVGSDWDRVQREHQIYYIDTIYTNEIMLSYNNKFYGPFEYDRKEDYIVLVGKKGNQYFISEYEQDDLSKNIYLVDNPETDANIQLIAKNMIQSPMDRVEKIDWIDDEKLIDYLSNILKKQKLNTKDEIRRFKENISTLIEEESEMSLDASRKQRLAKILNLTDERNELVQMIVRSAMEDEELNKEVARNICEEHFDYIEQNSPELKRYQEELQLLNQQKKDLTRQVEQAKANLEELAEQARLNQGEKINEIKKHIADLEEKRSSLKENIEELLSTINGINDVKELERKKEELKKEADQALTEKEIRDRDLERTRKKQEHLEKELTKIIENFNDETKLVVSKLDKEFLNKVFREISGEQCSDIDKFDSSLFYEHHLTGDDIINIVQDYLNDVANRNVPYNEVVNYLACIGQGFITTFAGQPGTGKTSICSLIAKALGLAGKNGNKRFIEIPVERGWTSHKDFIGYYNPLTKRMEKSNAEVYDAFEKLNKEVDDEVTAPMIMLLDEANLSPIEHYWATFIKNCDFDSTTERIISLGGNVKWSLPDNLRFLATVNFDHTTEELSPRFLDRSWVIILEPMQIDEDSLRNELPINAEKVVSFNDFIGAFGQNQDVEVDDNILIKWKSIRNIFKDNNMMIVPRNVKMVLNYCRVASRYMKRDTPETRFAPLDFAVAQKILPTIHGAGANVDKLVKQLREECGESNMPLCSKILKRMQENAADNMGYYQFFAI